MGKLDDLQGPMIEKAPASGIQRKLEQPVIDGRKDVARLFGISPAENEGTLKAHADPFDRAIEAEVA
ncbi:hypothetical protein JXD20_02560 [Candidatus Peregrinibacteria bacterium]|nr:hypothetical protein [Candidatus Peregrinibacteria bacterium]